MNKQLLLSKRIYLEGYEYSERGDSVSSGIATSLFQDAVEMFIWTLIKARGVPVKENSQFTNNIDAISKAGIELAFIPQLHELNKARVNFKHYGNLPAPDEARKFHSYVRSFLVDSFATHFEVNFEEISLVDLVVFEDVKERLRQGKQLADSGKYENSIYELAIAKELLFSRFNKFIPDVSNHLSQVDRAFDLDVPAARDIRAFEYITSYLKILRQASLAALIRLPLQDYSFIQNSLPQVSRFMNGEWRVLGHTSRLGIQYDEALYKRAMDCLVNLSLRMERLV